MFDVDPGQIVPLDSKQLVELLRRLLHSEALASGLALGGISVPLQITVADGGEDGRITWENGKDSTEYLPGRVNVFQSKASKLGPAGWKKECWVKSTQRRDVERELTPALTALLAEGGSYIGFTSEAFTGTKQKQYVKAIKDGIKDAGGDAAKLKAIRVYGANEIAAWATRHPGVAIWLAEQSHRRSLAGYCTIEFWGGLEDFARNLHAADLDKRYAIGAPARDEQGDDNRVTADTAWLRILDHIAVPGTLVRVVGASGLGKSRFVFESLRASSSRLTDIFRNSAVFADYRVVAATVLSTATRLAGDGNPTLLVVDECPRDMAIALAGIASAAGSALRVITLDTDDRLMEGDSVLQVSLAPSKGDLVEAIIRTKNPAIAEALVERLRDICGGFPRFAVLAAGNLLLAPSDFETADDIVDKILKGSSLKTEDDIRALETLCMFESIGVEGNAGRSPLDEVADKLGRMSGDEMYEHLMRAKEHDLVNQSDDELSGQPLPIAINLASRRLRVIRPSVLTRFLTDGADDLVLSLLRRWRHLDTLPIVIETATRLLHKDGALDSAAALLSTRGSAIADALVHIAPDEVADSLNYLVLRPSVDLRSLDSDARRHLVEALSKLVFRKHSFGTAARLLLRLATNETEDFSNNASGLFKHLFQLHLSGTEAVPAERFAVLDEGLSSDDAATRSICVDALASVFTRDFIRFGDSGQIGSKERLKDWSPRTHEEVNDFYREGIKRLSEIRGSYPEFAERAENTLARAARRLLDTAIYKEYAASLVEIAAEKGGWPEAVETVGDWLYFDRKDAPDDVATFVRQLYDQLFPSDPIERAILFTKFYRTDIRDPDVMYSDGDKDFDYSDRAARAIADEIASDPNLVRTALHRMAPLDLKSILPFAEQLALRVDDMRALFAAALEILETTGKGIGLLRGILRGLDIREHDLADEALAAARGRLSDKYMADLYSAVGMDVPRLDALLADVRAGKVEPTHCAFLSYGRGFDEIDVVDLARLLSELANHGSDGVWTALEICMMYRYGTKPSSAHEKEIIKLLAAPALVGPTSNRRTDGHIVDDLVQKIEDGVGKDEELAEGLARLVPRLVESKDYDTFSALDDAVRNIVVILRDKAPLILWPHVTNVFETATPIERNRLKRLIGPNADRFDRSNDTEAGPLFGIPEDVVFGWADTGPDRPAFLPDFYPTLTDTNEWHPALEAAAARYGHSPAFRDALAKRLRPSSWSGSIVPLLQVYLKPLESWFNHSVSAFATWAREQHRTLERRIERERSYEK
ncbi:hypothetical protein ACC720_32465 [Rhizobium ruizarguesonis]